MPQKQYELGDAELEVLNALWDGGASTVREVLGHLEGKGRQLAYTTVLTFLTRLEQKGYVASDKSGVAYVYRPKVTRDQIRRSRISTLVTQLYDGATGPLVLQLVRQRKLSSDEIHELHRLIEDLSDDDEPGS
ncbi:MAG: BlaI/MecI/CopY family transcriptional regulator [Phycisphaerae bacterium]